MLVPTSTGNDVSVELSHNLRALPGLIDVYLLLVDEVMRDHGFEEETGKFLVSQRLLSTSRSGRKSFDISNDIWLELSRVDLLSSDSYRWRTGEPPATAVVYEEEDLLVAAF